MNNYTFFIKKPSFIDMYEHKLSLFYIVFVLSGWLSAIKISIEKYATPPPGGKIYYYSENCFLVLLIYRSPQSIILLLAFDINCCSP